MQKSEMIFSYSNNISLPMMFRDSKNSEDLGFKAYLEHLNNNVDKFFRLLRIKTNHPYGVFYVCAKFNQNKINQWKHLKNLECKHLENMWEGVLTMVGKKSDKFFDLGQWERCKFVENF